MVPPAPYCTVSDRAVQITVVGGPVTAVTRGSRVDTAGARAARATAF